MISLSELEEEEKKESKFKAYSWGLGRKGALGHGDEKTGLLPREIKLPSKLSAVNASAGGYCSVLVASNGSCYGCGSNKHHRLGLSKEQDYLIPHKIPDLVAIEKVSCGLWHTLALNNIGKVFSCGYNKKGELGLGHRDPISNFTLVASLEEVKLINAGKSVSGFILADSAILTCGGVPMTGHTKDTAKPTPLKTPSSGTQIDCGTQHCACIDPEGGLYTWGYNDWSQLGHGGKAKKAIQIPRRVETLNEVKIVSVNCSKGEKYSHTICVDSEGSVYTWGSGYKGKLGHQSAWSHEDPADEPVPRKIEKGLQGTVIKRVEAGGIHNSVVTDKGQLLTFGCGSDGRLGHPECEGHRYLYKEGHPRKVESIEGKVVNVSFSYYHAILIAKS